MSSNSNVAYVRVPIDLVESEKELPCNLFVLINGKYIRYRHQGDILETDTLDRLRRDGLHSFFSDDPQGYVRHLETAPLPEPTPEPETESAPSQTVEHEDEGFRMVTGSVPHQKEEVHIVTGKKAPKEDNSAFIVKSRVTEEEGTEPTGGTNSEIEGENVAPPNAPVTPNDIDRAKQIKKANTIITSLLAAEKSKPKDISVKVALAKAYLEGNRIDDALQVYRGLKRKFAHSPAGYVGIIETYLFRKWTGKAQGEFEEFEKLFANDPNVPRLKAVLNKCVESEIQEKQKAREEASKKREAQSSAQKEKLDALFKK